MDDDSNGYVSDSEAYNYGMSNECFTMYSDLEFAMTGDSGFSKDSYNFFYYVREDFDLMRGQNYDIDLMEFEEFLEDPIDYLYFLMYDVDQSLEVTWDEFCLGTSKVMRVFYYTFEEDWYGIPTADFADATQYDDLSVRHYDYDNDGFIYEFEWVMAEIQLNEFQYYVPSNSLAIPVADLLAADWEANKVTLFDVMHNDAVSMSDWLRAYAELNLFDSLSNDDDLVADD